MLHVGSQQCLTSRSRRELLKVGLLPLLGLAGGNSLLAEQEATPERSGARAKSIILLWLWGGPSHVDTFDLKPQAPLEYRGPYAPIATQTPGIQICELLPRIAKCSSLYSIIRSLHATSNDHGIAGTIGLTGSEAGGISLGGQTNTGQLQPTHGAIVSKILGFSPDMPRFVTIGQHLHQGHKAIAGEGGGALGALHDPFRVDYSLEAGIQLPHLELQDGMTPSGLDARRELLRGIDTLAREIERAPDVTRLEAFYEQAFALLTNPRSRAAFDLDEESDQTRRRYGKFRFGQCCLLARRLIEADAGFVQVNWSSHVEPVEDTGDGGWDMHDRNFQQFQDRHAWMLDQSLSALLGDLHERGLLESTVVVAVGEFGRTPKINGKSGRDHWHQCYSGLIAGGGLQSGKVIGASDPLAEFPVETPVTPADLFLTALHQVGIGTPELTGAGLLPLGSPVEGLL